jgi:molybdopterin synthase sulfur carrier subunit
MMTLKVLAFAVVKNIFGNASVQIELKEGSTVSVLRTSLEEKFPGLRELSSFLIAVNNEFASANYTIQESDEIAIIPPVSGG